MVEEEENYCRTWKDQVSGRRGSSRVVCRQESDGSWSKIEEGANDFENQASLSDDLPAIYKATFTAASVSWGNVELGRVVSWKIALPAREMLSLR